MKNPAQQGVIAGSFQAVDDHPHQRRPLQGGGGEDPLRGLDVSPGEGDALGGEADPPRFDGGEAEQLERVDEREQVVDLQTELVRQLGHAQRTELGHDLRQPRQAIHGGVGQRHLAGVRRSSAGSNTGGSAVTRPVMMA